jgi:hypothetical protein
VDIGGQRLPAYPNHPDRRLARVHKTVDKNADKAQGRRWYKAGTLNGYGRMLRDKLEFGDAYSRGWYPLTHVHPDDRPPLDVQHDFYGALQDWLAVNLPFLTLTACATSPADPPLAASRLRVPGDGEVWTDAELAELREQEDEQFIYQEEWEWDDE